MTMSVYTYTAINHTLQQPQQLLLQRRGGLAGRLGRQLLYEQPASA